MNQANDHMARTGRQPLRQEGGFRIYPYSTKQLAALYRCSPRTMTRWIKRFDHEVGPKLGHLYYPKQVAIIVEKLGAPTSAADDDSL